MKDTLIVYSYYESDWRHKNAKFFFDHGESQFADVFFVETIDDFENNQDSSLIRSEVPSWIQYKARENVGYDLCTWKAALTKMEDVDIGKYKFFIFMNASIRGPFIAPIYRNGGQSVDWTRLFTQQISDNNKLIGTSINCRHGGEDVHLQSMLLATDTVGVELILEEDVWKCDREQSKKAIIDNGEIGVSRLFIKRGFNLVSQMEYWNGHDFMDIEATNRKCKVDCDGQTFGRDIYYEGKLCGFSLQPWEMVFFKSNREVAQKQLERYTEWIDNNENK